MPQGWIKSWQCLAVALGGVLGGLMPWAPVPAWADRTEASPTTAATGLWLTSDRSGVVSFAPCAQARDGVRQTAMCVRIVGNFLDPGEQVPLDYLGRSQCGLTIVTDALPEDEPRHWAGHVMDPRDGDLYTMKMWLGEDDKLHLRGYLVLPVLGRTETWTRYTGAQPPADCKMRSGAH